MSARSYQALSSSSEKELHSPLTLPNIRPAMGLSLDSTTFLLDCWKGGVSFQQTLTLGRQSMFPSPQKLERLLRDYGAWPPSQGPDEFRADLASAQWRIEVFVRALGAATVNSCDMSPYEGATLVHDLNQAVPPEWEEQYDVVLDGGTLEHVFNFPVAISNCMRMVKLGGHMILFTPINNYCGHGFYQFSPELFFRVLSAENGFEVRRMVALEDSLVPSTILGVPYAFPVRGRWHEVSDPASVAQRVTLINCNSTVAMILARRTARQPLFAKTPQQSDYVPQWKQGAPSSPTDGSVVGRSLVTWLRARLPESVSKEVLPRLALMLDPLRVLRNRRRNSFANRRNYQATPR